MESMLLPTVSWVTSCWEGDWRFVLGGDELKRRKIGHHNFPFLEKVLVINNVADLPLVESHAQAKIEEGVIDRYIVATDEIFSSFGLCRDDFHPEGVSSEWIVANARAPLSAIFTAQGEYLLYMTGDVGLDETIDWIPPSLRWMEKDPRIKVANPLWNGKKEEAKRESYRTSWNFYRARSGFSDQLFLVRKKDFMGPIYHEIRSDSHHFPRGDVFEKRVFSYMKNRCWERIIYRRGSYTHENV